MLPVGTYNITATYNGDGVFAAESNLTAPLTHTVTIGSTAVTLTSSAPNGSVYGQPVTFTANVSIPGSSAVPAGAVDFVVMNGTTKVDYGAFSLTNGVATIKLSSLPTGTDIIEATYTGSPDSTPSNASLEQSVSQDATNVSLTSTSVSNAPVTLTATVAPAAPGGGVPTGTVTFYIDGTQVGVAALNNSGVAQFVYSAGVSTGNHTIEAIYGGDGNFTGNSAMDTIDFVVGRGT
jgi:hypothetical protein